MNPDIPRKLAEFHVHLEGCVWREHIESWWDRSEYLFPPPSPVFSKKFTFDNFLEHLRFGYNFLNHEDAYAAVAALYATKAAADGICYSEMQINYALIQTWQLDLERVLFRINEQCQAASPRLVLRFVIDLPWQFDARSLLDIVDNMATFWDLGIRGISMGGDENYANPGEVKKIFADARASGLRVLCHAGEITSHDVARKIIEILEPDRIAHGISIANWITAMGPQSPPIDVCLSSNLALGVIDSLESHPLNDWYQAGVPLSLSTDDPAIFGTTLTKEYELAGALCPAMFESVEKLHTMYLRCALDKDALAGALQ